jgi:hypothetical protein
MFALLQYFFDQSFVIITITNDEATKIITLTEWCTNNSINMSEKPDIGIIGTYCCPIELSDRYNIFSVSPLPDYEGDPPTPNIITSVCKLVWLKIPGLSVHIDDF